MTKVAITELEYRKAAAYFDAQTDFEWLVVPPDETRLAAAIREQQARHAVIGVRKYTGALYEALPRGGVLARFGVGHDGVDKQLAAAHGLYCVNTPGALDRSVAEFAIGMMIAVARHLAHCAGDLENHVWHNRVGSELCGRKLLIIGCGEIGTSLARIAHYGLDMEVSGLVRHLPGTGAEPPFAALYTDFAEAVRDADYISLHIPESPENYHYMDAARLACCKPGAVLINTARGAVLDEAALFDAVQAGRLAGAALDVFAAEPYAPVAADKDLRTLPQILMTPHLGSSTVEACTRVAAKVVENLRAAECGDYARMNLVH